MRIHSQTGWLINSSQRLGSSSERKPELRRTGSVLDVQLGTDHGTRVIRALANDGRAAILQLLQSRTLNVSEIADALGATMSATSENIKVLSEAGLIATEMTPGTRGLQKACGRAVDAVVINLPKPAPQSGRAIELSMPVGGFADFEVHPTCGLVGASGTIGMFDDARSFYEPERVDAQLLWFHHGWVEYRFPNRVHRGERIASLQLSMEVCSEAPLHNENWPSDIIVSVNGVPLGAWTSPGDFGDQPGALTPAWWSTANTQFGLMKVWQVTDDRLIHRRRALVRHHLGRPRSGQLRTSCRFASQCRQTVRTWAGSTSSAASSATTRRTSSCECSAPIQEERRVE